MTTPRYTSYTESKIIARAGASASPTGGGIWRTISSSRCDTPTPVLPETRRQSSGWQPIRWASSSAYFSGCAAGRSILLSTGMTCRSFSMRQVQVGQGLRLDPLGRVDQQHGALAGGQAAADTS